MTLWPEVEKVCGHGYEYDPLASSSSSELPTALSFAGPVHLTRRVDVQDHVCFYLQIDISDARRRPYILRKRTNYQPVGTPLDGHSLTVTRVAFSPPDDKYILRRFEGPVVETVRAAWR